MPIQTQLSQQGKPRACTQLSSPVHSKMSPRLNPDPLGVLRLNTKQTQVVGGVRAKLQFKLAGTVLHALEGSIKAGSAPLDVKKHARHARYVPQAALRNTVTWRRDKPKGSAPARQVPCCRASRRRYSAALHAAEQHFAQTAGPREQPVQQTWATRQSKSRAVRSLAVPSQTRTPPDGVPGKTRPLYCCLWSGAAGSPRTTRICTYPTRARAHSARTPTQLLRASSCCKPVTAPGQITERSARLLGR